jgi:hypothetical protein
VLQPTATNWWSPWRRAWWRCLCSETLVHALAPLVRMLATMAINDTSGVACCRTAHRVIALPVSGVLLSTRGKIFLKWLYLLYYMYCSYLHLQKLSLLIFSYYFITRRLSSAVSCWAQFRSILFCRCKTANMAADLIIDGRSRGNFYADVDMTEKL